MKDWLQYNATKAPHELAEAAAELGVARQLASENPGMVVRVGRENNAPLRPGTTDQRMKEFDLSVETPGGRVVKVVEVTSVAKPVATKGDVSGGVRHAVDKVLDRQGSAHPLQGSREALIHMTLDVGEAHMGRGGRGPVRKIDRDGTVRFFQPDGKTPIEMKSTSGNVYDDIAGNLSSVKNNALLDRITLVDQSGRRIVFERQGTTWTRE
jgi:hypothetical protein